MGLVVYRARKPLPNKRGYHVLRMGTGIAAPVRRFVPGTAAVLAAGMLLCCVGAAGGAGASPEPVSESTLTERVSETDARPEGLFMPESLRAVVHPEEEGAEIVAGTGVNPAETQDIGGELVSMSDSDIQQALPANVRLDRITIDLEVTKPLSSARISSFFGFRKNPVSGKYTFHTGLDLAAPEGSEIHAMYSGKVKTAAYDKGYGNYIVLDHGGFQTLYAHCSKLRRSAGDSVSAGDVIALVGSTGNSTGNHLHVEFRRDGQRYDPEWILGGIYS